MTRGWQAAPQRPEIRAGLKRLIFHYTAELRQNHCGRTFGACATFAQWWKFAEAIQAHARELTPSLQGLGED